jgi:peptidoglycan/LPS O-acetylase OafA/YrhL
MTLIAPLTSLRFFAAFWVLLFHLRIHLAGPQPILLERILLAGPLAMTFFFVLSGFILVVASQGKEPWQDMAGYAWRRFARIYPIYLAYLILFWVVIGFAGNLGGKPLRAAAFLGFADLTLTNAWFPQAFLGGFGRDGSWSLSAEVFFYALFPFLLLHARQMSDRALILAVRWSVAFAVFGALAGKYLPPQGSVAETVYYSLPIFRLPEFAAGVFYAVWVLRDHARLPSGRKLAILAAAFFVYVCVAAHALPYVGGDFILVPFLLCLFAYFMRAEAGWASRLLSSRPMVFLGEISFGLYLMQIFTINLYLQPGRGRDWMGGIVGCLAMTLALAAAAHLLIEKPMRTWLLSKRGEAR